MREQFYVDHMRVRLLTLLVLLMVCSVTSCSSPTKSAETLQQVTLVPTKPSPAIDWPDRWLKGTPCKPPCWEGVIPGQTTASEATKILNASPIVLRAEMTTTTKTSDNGIVLWSWLDGQSGGQAYYHARSPEQTIYTIAPYFPKPFALRKIIQVYGEPSDILARAYHNPDNSIASDVSIFYRSQGIVLFAGAGGYLTLSLDMTFDYINFFEPTNEGLKVALGGSQDHLDWLTPWQGIRDFDFYCKDSESEKACRGGN